MNVSFHQKKITVKFKLFDIYKNIYFLIYLLLFNIFKILIYTFIKSFFQQLQMIKHFSKKKNQNELDEKKGVTRKRKRDEAVSVIV